MLDSRTRSAVGRGVRVELTTREFLLLEHLMAHAGETCTARTLLEVVWNGLGDAGLVGRYVQQLREKLGDSIIETISEDAYRYPLEPGRGAPSQEDQPTRG